MSLCDRVVLVMSAKYAQRRPADDIALELRVAESWVEVALCHLRSHRLVRPWGDGQWGLTQSGNSRRNRLT